MEKINMAYISQITDIILQALVCGVFIWGVIVISKALNQGQEEKKTKECVK